MEPTFEDLLSKLQGKYPWFQLCLCVLGCCVSMSACMCVSLPVFILTIPDHRCALDEWDNDTYGVQHSHHRQLINASIPADETGKMSSCTIFSKHDVNISSQNTTPEVTCERWVYDKSFSDRSLVTDLDLVCDLKYARTVGNVLLMLGRLMASPLQGCISDRFGRKLAVTCSLIGLVVATWSSAFIYDIPSLYVLRFVAGVGMSQGELSTLVLAVEFLVPRYRGRYTSLLYFTWALGGFILVTMAYFVRDFQNLSFAIAVPTSLLLIFLWFVPESPRWLLSKGRTVQARAVLRRVARVNRVPFPEDLFLDVADTFKKKDSVSFLNSRGNAEASKHFENPSHAVRDSEEQEQDISEEIPETRNSFKHKSLWIRYFVLMICWFSYKLQWISLLYNISNLGGSLFLNFGLFNFVEFSSVVLVYSFMDRLGRSSSYLVLIFVAFVSCVASVLPIFFATPSVREICINVLGLIGIFGAGGAFVILLVYSAELVPTQHRNKAMSLFDVSGRVGGVSGSFVADLGLLLGGKLQSAIPLLVGGLVALAAFSLAWLLPETRGKPLPNTTEEAIKLKSTTRSENNQLPNAAEYADTK